MPHFPQRIWAAALFVAWAVDFLFWEKPVGISFLIFIIAALTAGFVPARFERIRPALFSIILSTAVIGLAVATLVRVEPLTRMLSGLLAMVGLALLARTFRTGGWIHFRVISLVLFWIDILVIMLSRAAGLPLAPKAESGRPSVQSGLRRVLPVVRGLLLAFPVVILLAALLASADLVFADQVNTFLKNFDLDKLPEYLLRLFFILVMTYLLAGLYLQAILPHSWLISLPGDENNLTLPELEMPTEEGNIRNGEQKLEEENEQSEIGHSVLTDDKAEGKLNNSLSVRILGPTEAFIVLCSVNILFSFFVAIQFRYLFGGQANITSTGYTFSEYARRGFFELVSVAAISLLLYLVLNAVTRRNTPTQERFFTVLAALLVGLVLVILVSAFQRLVLYENAYGFTRLRMYTHIIIPWMGLLLFGTIVLQSLRRDQYFGLLMLVVVFGFALTYVILNVDGLIARLNIARAHGGLELDGTYLLSLSDDALPEIVKEFQDPKQTASIRDTLGSVLACRVHDISLEETIPWQSYHPGRAFVRRWLVGVNLADYPIREVDGSVYVDLEMGTNAFQCYRPGFID